MQPLGTVAVTLLAASCASSAAAPPPPPVPAPPIPVAAPADPPAPEGPKETPPPPPALPAVDEEKPPAPAPSPAPAPVAEEPPAKKVEEAPRIPPEVASLLAEAAKRQGTADLVGEKAPGRFRAVFGTVVVFSEKGDRAQTKTTETFALPKPGSTEARLRSEWVTDAGKPTEKRVVLGHNGKFGWMWTTDEGLRRFTDPSRDEQDIRDLDDRRRMLRLALRVFFLGNLTSGPAAVTLAPDREVVLPMANGESRKMVCRILQRAAVPDDGEFALRLFLEKESLDPVAVEIPAGGPEESGFLLTVDFIDSAEVRAKRNYPAGVRVPDWLELFELPPGEGAKPRILIQAGLDALVIDPSKIPDEAFAVPK